MNKRKKPLQEVLNKNTSCYVLITCGQPSEDGKMQVEMTYQGDAALAAYLLQGAQFFFEPEEDFDSINPIRMKLLERLPRP